MTDAAVTGQRVLDALAEGRRRAIEEAKKRAAQNERAVRDALDVDIIACNPERGRAGRIARAVRGRVRVHISDGEDRDYISAKGVQKILERLSSGSDSACSDASAATGEPSAAK